MSDLLPPNATPQERALSEAIARISGVDVSGIRAVWNPDTCPANLLPWLAWAFSVDQWDSNWLEEQRRETVRRAIAVQRKKGTAGAVKSALGALGFTARLQEWHQLTPAGAPYTFRLCLETSAAPITSAEIAAAIATVDSVKNLRSHLERTEIAVSVPAQMYVGGAVMIGNEITVSGFVPGSLIINENAICIP